MSDPAGVTVRVDSGELERAGKRLKMRCPWHEEDTPSLAIDIVDQSFHCFGCGKRGTVEGTIHLTCPEEF